MPITYLKGAGAAIGRTREAADAQHDEALCAATSAGRQVPESYSMLGLYADMFAIKCLQVSKESKEV